MVGNTANFKPYLSCCHFKHLYRRQSSALVSCRLDGDEPVYIKQQYVSDFLPSVFGGVPRSAISNACCAYCRLREGAHSSGKILASAKLSTRGSSRGFWALLYSPSTTPIQLIKPLLLGYTIPCQNRGRMATSSHNTAPKRLWL